MKIKTSKLIGLALDWAVAMCEGKYVTTIPEHTATWDAASRSYFRRRHEHLGEWIVLGRPGEVQALPKYSTDWFQGGPIIEKMRGIKLKSGRNPKAPCYAHIVGYNGVERWHQTGKTLLIAAMRCYVASKLGDEVEVPEELLT